MPSSLPYTEPAPLPLLITTVFILLLNIVNSILDRLIYCGLIGQILVGVALGSPGAGLLGVELERLVGLLGYIGLVGLVYEGGLSTEYRTLRPNLPLSLGIAATGISLPIALSYTLPQLLSGTATGIDVTPIQAFAAGAALCSTSLGTTFTVLASCGLVKTRMGVVLSTAAMLDDVVGLVMVQVITNLGGGEISAITVVRPILVSVAFAILTPAVAVWVVRPVTMGLNGWRDRKRSGLVGKVMSSTEFAFCVHTIFLVTMVVGSSYAGTSNLFAAWLAGASVSWWDGDVPHLRMRSDVVVQMGVEDEGGRNHELVDHELTRRETRPSTQGQDPPLDGTPFQPSSEPNSTSGIHVFSIYYAPSIQRILKPFFFASIGFSIPITQMFQRSIVWRGIIYSMLMFVGKLACGLWLVRLPKPISSWWGSVRVRKIVANGRKDRDEKTNRLVRGGPRQESTSLEERVVSDAIAGKTAMPTDETIGMITVQQQQRQRQPQREETDELPFKNTKELQQDQISSRTPPNHSNGSKPIPRLPHDTVETTTSRNTTPNPISLYPTLILGSAMTARGEIGFLISSLAQSNGVFDNSTNSSSTPSSSSSSSSKSSADSTPNPNTDSSSPIFLVVTWAIVLCTIVGPGVVGFLVRRVRRLERGAGEGEEGEEGNRERKGTPGVGRRKGRDVLGIWGV